MITRRSLISGAVGTVGASVLAVAPGGPVSATDRRWARAVSANGWRIESAAVAVYRVTGSAASVALRRGPAAAVLLHVARRWHYEIAPLDTGEGGGITGHDANRTVRVDVESNYLSGTAVAVYPTAYPLGGSEPLWPHQEAVVRDILADCGGTVAWGGDLTPTMLSHFHVVARPGDPTLAQVAARLDPGAQVAVRSQTAGAVADPAAPERLELARRFAGSR
ncbi:hypothetical protein O7632_21940 [Solwaraspora sp. WMMD406]|uniref:hypothetical protein n=1 Tax=Solwaraspora sp. WMMD406 TaxID=3016095 RepID=UPI002417A010|nr:hypothetical protein [Solwaraspora sp. WMMD406]MDG4766738.1 hypothetical protein [Solwaraspora sp. WMMD406]